MTEPQVSQEHIAKTYTLRLLSYMEDMAEDAMIDLDVAGLSAELSMVSLVRDAIQNASAYLEDPKCFVAVSIPEDEGGAEDEFDGEVDE